MQKRDERSMLKEIIYQIMNGEIENIMLPEGIEVVDEFCEGRECEKLYDRVYAAKLNLSKRLGVDEDRDVEEIISCMGSISRILALKMYEYGCEMSDRVQSACHETDALL